MFQLIAKRRDQRIYRYHSLLLQLQWTEFRLEHFRAIQESCAKVVDDHEQCSSIVIIRGDFNFAVPADVRKAGAALTKEWEPYNTGQAMVIEVEGFKGSVARSILAGVNLLARAKAPQRVFKDAREGTEWVCGLRGQPEQLCGGTTRVWQSLDQLLGGLPIESPD